MKAVAVDVSGNISEAYIAEFGLKASAPGAPVLELFQENWQLRLEWRRPETVDFYAYRLYRKTEADADFTAIGYTDQETYTDTDVVPEKVYSYMVESYDIYGNHTASNAYVIPNVNK